jgi:hypothetical protein
MPGTETYEIAPRDYGTIYYSDQPVFITPAKFAIGDFLRISPKQKKQWLEEWHSDFLERYEREEAKLSKKYEQILESPSKLREVLLENLRKREGTVKLVNVGNGTAIRDGYFSHALLTGRVKSRRHGGRDKILKDWSVTVKLPDYSNLFCQCDDFDWNNRKGLETACVHIGALINQAADEYLQPEEGIIEFADKQTVPALPFILSSLAKTDVVVRHYVFEEGYYKINKELLENPENYNPGYRTLIENDSVTFEPISQRRKKRKVGMDFVKAQEYTKDGFEKRVMNAGFKRTGFGAIEFKNTPYETFCVNYQKENKCIRLVFNPNFPPIAVFRELGNEKRVFSTPQQNHPFSNPYKETEDIDDRTKRTSKTTTFIPGPKMIKELEPMKIIGNFKEAYAKLITDNYKEDSTQLLKELGLSR